MAIFNSYVRLPEGIWKNEKKCQTTNQIKLMIPRSPWVSIFHGLIWRLWFGATPNDPRTSPRCDHRWVIGGPSPDGRLIIGFTTLADLSTNISGWRRLNTLNSENYHQTTRQSYFTIFPAGSDKLSPQRWKLSCGLFRHLTGIQAVGKDLRRWSNGWSGVGRWLQNTINMN